MKIIKQFEDREFAKEQYPEMDCWTWGLGDDGNLYYRDYSPEACLHNKPWYCFASPSNGQIAIKVSIKYMKKIVSEFGNLLPFI